MNRTAHIVGGACAGVITSTALISNPISVAGLLGTTAFMAGSLAGCLLPDVDHPESTYGKKIKILSKMIATTGHRGITHAPLVYMFLLSLFLILDIRALELILVIGFEYLVAKEIAKYTYKLKIVKKPYLLHFAIFLFMVFLTLKFSAYLHIIYGQLLIGMFFGALSHIFMDSLTIYGTPWFYPISKRKFRILKLKTGKNDGIGILIAISITVLVVYLIKFN